MTRNPDARCRNGFVAPTFAGRQHQILAKAERQKESASVAERESRGKKFRSRETNAHNAPKS
jgi:hypothetical protein